MVTVFVVLISKHTYLSDQVSMLGYVMIGAASLGQVTQWFPQIWRTYHLKHIGALSIPMLLLQGVGAALTAYFFYLDDPSWYMWTPFVVASVLITILSIMAIYYWRRDRKAAKEASINDSEDSRPLLLPH